MKTLYVLQGNKGTVLSVYVNAKNNIAMETDLKIHSLGNMPTKYKDYLLADGGETVILKCFEGSIKQGDIWETCIDPEFDWLTHLYLCEDMPEMVQSFKCVSLINW